MLETHPTMIGQENVYVSHISIIKAILDGIGRLKAIAVLNGKVKL